MNVPNEIWVVEWTYSPADFVEESMEISHEDYNLTIQDGKVEAIINHDPRPEICEQLNIKLECRFRGVQLESHKPYELNGPSVNCHHSNGERILYVKSSPSVKEYNGIVASNYTDLTITNKNGNKVADTRAERIERKRLLGDLAAKYGLSNPLAGELLSHYNKAINDRDHFLVHLYDITEALTRQFGKKVKTILRKTQWKDLRVLANDAPLREGRHRARSKPAELRNASEGEWDTAFNIAAEVIVKYLKYLDEQKDVKKTNEPNMDFKK